MDPSSSHGDTGGCDQLANNNCNKNSKQQQQQRDSKRQQFTNKQRIDMYAFCVLELEMHSNKVSIKKQQQAIQRVLSEQRKEKLHSNGTPDPQRSPVVGLEQLQNQQPLAGQTPQQQPEAQQKPPVQSKTTQASTINSTTLQQQQPSHTIVEPLHEQTQLQTDTSPAPTVGAQEVKTLLELQQEVAIMRRCYSDYQKTQVLTSSMLREVQKRFARYYPESAIPSRTTIKHVFEKCVLHGTVENIKTPRKATKIPQGDEIEYLLIHEPQLSLRQMAQKLNVSTGTVSRRCKALGLVPESVTIKHQQLATARRQKQIKQLETQSKQATLVLHASNESHHQHQLPPSNGTHELLDTSTQEHTNNVIN